MDELVGKEIDAFRPIDFFDLQVIPTFNVQRDRVHALVHDISRSVCTYDSTYLDETQCMCAYDDTSRLDSLRGSRLVSYAHTVYEMMNDDESLD